MSLEVRSAAAAVDKSLKCYWTNFSSDPLKYETD